ncbi:allantoicase [Aquitalea pelogenes]|uniref:allantoicase n=1 Tax=Aquitalea pelogenes TaxID=1293573 RepID=UPI0009EB1790|nr:allantoicase [Aquitalea pelogenes]
MSINSQHEFTVLHAATVELPDYARHYVNLADADFGAKVVHCSDEWFAPAERMLQSASPVFLVGKFDDHGKWMDGWETQRRRNGGHDHAVIQLGLPGVIKGIDIDTSHFTGNFPPASVLEACYSDGVPDENTQWTTLIPAVSIRGNAHHFFAIDEARVWTHVRLNIYPDGGVARLRVYGEVHIDWSSKDKSALYEVSALQQGGRVLAYNDAHFGVPFRLIMPGRGVNMGDGWETRRRREPGNDWCIVKLGHAAVIERIEVDTAHFKGNYPDSVSIQAALVRQGTEQSIVTQAMFWETLLPEQKMTMDAQHFFDREYIRSLGPVNHVRLNIFPDGGVSRLRIFGRLASE